MLKMNRKASAILETSLVIALFVIPLTSALVVLSNEIYTPAVVDANGVETAPASGAIAEVVKDLQAMLTDNGLSN